ncbi:o-succinylbenzoate--CoA ligase [Williamsia soli]|uniref:o-succinylbenzoate--CoA ligase n=1 Tax=Williamsia soli TaxID=364929 RepID=UPI001A9DFC9E|nr:o-succinylbenzoate--CoA ligase [Williamsia soli]
MSGRTLQPLPLSAGAPDLGALHQLLDGSGSFAPVPLSDPAETARLSGALGIGEPIERDIALVIATSGTTGTPKGAQHSTASVTASIDATHAHLGGLGGWLLALPPHHIAGLQVLLRSLRAGVEPTTIDVSGGFDPADLVRALESMTSTRRYTSLVPTQLVKVLDHPGAIGALREVDAVLVGGAATPLRLRERATAAGIPIVGTYGMSETCGGCVYDGVPLPGTRIRIDGGHPGRVVLGGPMVASGYRGRPDHPAFAEPGWFRTDDLGELADGVLTIVGRTDEAISSGGLTIVPQVVEAAILRDPAIGDCAVFGLPDERLGDKVVAAVVASPGANPTTESVQASVARTLDRTAVPRDVFFVDELPRRGPGKVDRAALRALLS